jgi:hypothetical protein
MADLQPFDNYDLQKVIRDGWDQAESGELTVTANGFEKKLLFQDGVIQFATSTDPDDKLPQIFIRQGKFTEENYEAVLPNFKADISVGRNLVEMGLVTQQELIQGAKSQVYHIFETAMLTQSGQYAFDTSEAPENVVSLPLSFPEDLFKAILNLDDAKWLSDQFGPSLNFVCERNTDRPINFSRINVADFAEDIWELIDGERDFNEIAFESDIDDRKLLKFIYALKLLKFVRVHDEDPQDDDTEDDDAKVEDDPIDRALLKDELGGAANHSDGIQGLADIPMDETVELSNMQALMDQQDVAQMEATTEISREVLKDAPEPEPGESLDDDWNTPVSGALDEEEGFPEPEDDEHEEAGLDDLGDDDQMGGLLEEELEKMNVPLQEMDDDFPEEDEEDEGEAKPGLVARLKERIAGARERLAAIDFKAIDLRKQWRLLALALVFVGLAAATLFVDFETLINGTQQEDQLSEDLAVLDEAANAGDTEPPAEDEPPAEEVAREETTEPEAAADVEVAEIVSEEQPTQEPEQTQQEETPPAENVVASNEQEPPVTQPEPEPVTTQEPEPADEPQKTNPSISFRSPIAEGWDPSTGQPQGSSNVAQPQETRTVARNTTPAQQPAESVQPPKSQAAQLQQRDQVQPEQGQSRSAFIEPVRIDNNDAPISQPAEIALETASDTGNPRQQLERNQLAQAAANWRSQMQPKSASYTLALFLACQEQSVRDAYQKFAPDEGFFVLPYTFNGRSCYWACTGTFDTYGEALTALPALRERFPDTDISVKELSQILR